MQQRINFSKHWVFANLNILPAQSGLRISLGAQFAILNVNLVAIKRTKCRVFNSSSSLIVVTEPFSRKRWCKLLWIKHSLSTLSVFNVVEHFKARWWISLFIVRHREILRLVGHSVHCRLSYLWQTWHGYVKRSWCSFVSTACNIWGVSFLLGHAFVRKISIGVLLELLYLRRLNVFVLKHRIGISDGYVIILSTIIGYLSSCDAFLSQLIQTYFVHFKFLIKGYRYN